MADGGVSVPVLVCTRVGLGSLLLAPAAVRGGHLRALKGHVRWLAAFTALEIVGPFALLSNAEKHLPSSTSGLLVAAVPIFSALLAWLTRSGDRLTADPVGRAGRRAGRRGPAGRAGRGPGHVVPVLEVLGTALGYSIGPLIANRKLSHLPPVAVNTVCLGAAALVYAPFAALTWPRHVPSLRGPGGPGRPGRGLHRGRVPDLLPPHRRGRPGRATVIIYVNPAVAVALGVLVLGEHLTAAIGAPSRLSWAVRCWPLAPARPAAPPRRRPPEGRGWR